MGDLDESKRLTITQTRIKLAMYGKHILSYYRYAQLLKSGQLEQPIRTKGAHPVHTISQLERYKLRLLNPPEIKRVGKPGRPVWEKHLWER